MAKKTNKRRSGRVWIGGRCRFPAYIVEPGSDAAGYDKWMDEKSRFILVMEAILPDTPDFVLLDRFHQALNHPKVDGARTPTCLRVAESR